MRGRHVRDVDPPVKELVGLDVRVGVGGAHVVVIVALREETRGPQDDDRQAVLGVGGASHRSSAAVLVTP